MNPQEKGTPPRGKQNDYFAQTPTQQVTGAQQKPSSTTAVPSGPEQEAEQARPQGEARSAAQKGNRILLFATLGVAGLALAALGIAMIPPKPVPLASVPPGALYGSPDAPQEVVIFEDFKCSHCASLHADIQPLLDGPVAKGEVQLHILNFPFVAKDSTGAAAAAQCVYNLGGADAHRTFSTLMFDEQLRVQQKYSDPWITQELLSSFAKDVGLSEQAFTECATSETTRESIRAQAAAYENGRGLGTPGVFVNRQFTRQTLADIEQALRERPVSVP